MKEFVAPVLSGLTGVFITVFTVGKLWGKRLMVDTAQNKELATLKTEIETIRGEMRTMWKKIDEHTRKTERHVEWAKSVDRRLDKMETKIDQLIGFHQTGVGVNGDG